VPESLVDAVSAIHFSHIGVVSYLLYDRHVYTSKPPNGRRSCFS